MEHRFGQRIRRRELPELRLEVDQSPTPVDRRGKRRNPGAGVIVRPTELRLNAWCELSVGTLSGRCPPFRVGLLPHPVGKGTDSSWLT
jgi:hypothetical protein